MSHNKQFIIVIPINSFIYYYPVIVPHQAIIAAFTQSQSYQFIVFKSV